MQSTLLQKSLNGLEPFFKEHPLLMTGCIQTLIVIMMHMYGNHQRTLFMLGAQGIWQKFEYNTKIVYKRIVPPKNNKIDAVLDECVLSSQA